MNPVIIWFIAFQIVCLLSFGCGNLKVMHQASPAEIQREESLVLKDSDIKSVLEYYRHLYSLNEEELNREYSQAQQTLSESNQLIDRIRLALLLSMPRAPFKEYDRSLTLVKDYLNDPSQQDSRLKDFLSILSSFIQELKSQDERYQKLDQKLKEEKKQREALEQKLEELKTIEKNLLERDKKNKP
jgi:DNA repair ATPase RecN